MQDKDKKIGLLALATKRLLRDLDILLQLADGILERSAGIINLVDDENVLSNEVGHLEGTQIQPLGAGDLGTRDLFGVTTAQVLVQRQADSLDGDVGIAGPLEEGSQDARGDVASAADGDHQVRVEFIQDLVARVLAEFVDLAHTNLLLVSDSRAHCCRHK